MVFSILFPGEALRPHEDVGWLIDFAAMSSAPTDSKYPEISEVGRNQHSILYPCFGGGSHRLDGGYRIGGGAKCESAM